MSVKMRQEVERKICTAVVEALLAAGFAITVDNGDDIEPSLASSTDKEAILKAMFLTDDERLYAEKDREKDRMTFGWVYFVYGNDGWDVISDYTVNLEPFIGEGTETQKIVDQYAD